MSIREKIADKLYRNDIVSNKRMLETIMNHDSHRSSEYVVKLNRDLEALKIKYEKLAGHEFRG